MAELTSLPVHTGPRLGWEQFRAIAWLRWRILVNGFRRKGGAGELIGRIFLLPLLAALVVLPSLLAGFFAWYVSMHGELGRVAFVLWGAFALTQLLNINIGQPGTTFDPTELIRFPLRLQSYVLVRLCFGLLSPANIVVALMSAAIFAGITLDRPQLWPWTLLATVAFALANVLFSRMVFAWVDRWLSTRRAREVFTALVFAGSLLFQYLNVTFNPGFQHGQQHQVTPANLERASTVYSHVHPWLQLLPPELTASAIVAGARQAPLRSLAATSAVLVYAALFFAVYALRMRTEYLGENLSDVANATRSAAPRPALTALQPSAAPQVLSSVQVSTQPSVLAQLGPLLGKELLVLRRNTGLLYGVVAPVVMVFLFAGRLSLRGGSHWLLLLAVGYALLGLAPASYNSFGLEGTGAQFYFMAPVPLRVVFLAKNLLQFLLAGFEVVMVIAIISYVAGHPRFTDVLFVALWAAGALLLNTTVGNLRSVSAPKRIKPGRNLNRAQSQVSAWIAIGILAGCAALGAGLLIGASLLRMPWLSTVLVACFAATAFVVYQFGLKTIENYTLARRDILFEELGKMT